MALFLSTFQNKIDKKGRVSVPASFRQVVAREEFNGIVAYPSFINPCIEACSMTRMEKLSQRIEELDAFSEERDAFATAILGGSVQLSFDGEGRVLIPELLIVEANLSDNALFIGKGETFEIWEPKAFAEHSMRSRQLAREKRGQIRGSAPPAGGAA
jgi:MraZ protein